MPNGGFAMRRLQLLMTLVCLWAALCPASAQTVPSPTPDKVEASTNDEIAERSAIMDLAADAVARRDYTGLQRLARHFRETRVRTPSGNWKLPYLYYGMEHGLKIWADDGSCHNGLIAFDRAWLNASPKDPAPIIALATALDDYAQCVRGEGFADTVTPAHMAAFHRNAQAAADLLEKNKPLASTDPQFYATSASIAVDLGFDRAWMHALLDEAAARYPSYYGTYFEAARYYLPHWYGQRFDIDQLARFAAAHEIPGEGHSAYARVLWSIASMSPK